MEVQYTCDAVTGPSVCSVVFFLPGGQSGTRSHTSHKQRDAGCHTQLFGVWTGLMKKLLFSFCCQYIFDLTAELVQVGYLDILFQS